VDYGPAVDALGKALRDLSSKVDRVERGVLTPESVDAPRVLPTVRRKANLVPPVQVDYDLDIQRLEDTVLALGDRVDAQAKKEPPVQVDYDPSIRRLDDAVLALGDRVDQM